MKIICIGRNYLDHIHELKNEVPESPVIFLKPDSAILPQGNPFTLPEWSTNMHYETEVVLKIGRQGKYIEEKFADKYVSHYTLGIDFTERDLQNQLKTKGLPWELSKGFDGSAVVGTWKEVNQETNLDNLNFYLDINGNKVQEGNTQLWMYNYRKVISFVSKYYTLKTGDILFTGTPVGVSAVQPNDVLTGFLEGEEMFRFKIK